MNVDLTQAELQSLAELTAEEENPLHWKLISYLCGDEGIEPEDAPAPGITASEIRGTLTLPELTWTPGYAPAGTAIPAESYTFITRSVGAGGGGASYPLYGRSWSAGSRFPVAANPYGLEAASMATIYLMSASGTARFQQALPARRGERFTQDFGKTSIEISSWQIVLE